MIRRCTAEDVPRIFSIVNEAAQRYRGAIPADCWHEPYMALEALEAEIAAGVEFWGFEEDSALVGVMGLQRVGDATLIRHAYVLAKRQRGGIGSALLRFLAARVRTNHFLVGTWAAAEWAIRFYERNGFERVEAAEKDALLMKYWKISERQREVSVVLRHGRA
jgi:GNAT superfamily N-acetyltransferase